MSLLLVDNAELIDAASELPNGRAAVGIWVDVVQQLRRSAHAMRDLGELPYADALDSDATSMERRAKLHLRGLVARSTPPTDTHDTVPQRPPTIPPPEAP